MLKFHAKIKEYFVTHVIKTNNPSSEKNNFSISGIQIIIIQIIIIGIQIIIID